MTLSRSSTPQNDRRELYESVQELDKLLEDLKKAQVTDERGYKSRLDQQQYYSSSRTSLNVPSQSSTYNRGSSRAGSRPNSATSDTPPPLRRLASNSKHDDDNVDYLSGKLETELSNKDSSSNTIPRGVFVKDVVEEEILVDHVPNIQPRQQQSDKKFVTRPSERRRGQERIKRQVVFEDHSHSRHQAQDDSETYDNTDTEDLGHQQMIPRRVERDDKSASMLSLNSEATDQSDSTLDPSKIINCYTCGDRVVGQVITALGRNYHKEHFTCAHCGQELGTRNFYEKEDKPYCEKDYQALFSPKCFACNEPILDKVTIALDQTFHPEHFVCAHCGCQFDVDDGFHEKDGRPYCKNDFFELFANKCIGCNLPITANYITALGGQWHPDCFVCSDCHCPFADGKFFDIDGAPYCEIHYHARRGSLCAVCRQPIIGKCTTAMFRKFHPDHFTCTYCLKVLTKSFKEENDKPYCHDCFEKLYS